MDIYRKTKKVKCADVDMFRRLTFSSLFTWFQETAIEHTTQIGVGRDKTLDRGFLWVVTQQMASINRLPEYDETVTLLSWPGKTLHMFFPRYWEILDTNGSVLISASSLWVLLNAETRKAVFPEEHGIQIDEMRKDYKIPLPPRVRSFPTEEGLLSQFTVPLSYTDMNGHMNNARYFDVAADLLEDPSLLADVCMISTEYTGELRHGQTMSVHRLLTSDSYQVFGEQPAAEGEKRNRPVFRMKFTLRNC